MRRTPLALWLLAIFAGTGAMAAPAAAEDSFRKACFSTPIPTDDQVIQGCSVIIQQRLDTFETMATAFYNRGHAYYSKGQLDLALADFDQAINMKPASALTLANRGYIYLRHSQFDRAMEDFNMAIRLQPDFAPAWLGRGHANYDQGKYDIAINDYTQVIALMPSFAPAAYNDRGVAYRKQNQFARAIQDYDQAIELEPSYATALGNRCFSRTVLNQLEAALADCTEARRLDRTSPQILDNLGFTYLKLLQPDRAIAGYNAALTLAPKTASALFGRGMARKVKGDSAGAEVDFAAAKAVQPNIADELRNFIGPALRDFEGFRGIHGDSRDQRFTTPGHPEFR
jgi:tetratricopeptide (TPR) repeat protein